MAALIIFAATRPAGSADTSPQQLKPPVEYLRITPAHAMPAPPCGSAGTAATSSGVAYDAARDVYRESHGCEFRQLFQEFKPLRGAYLDFEARFNALPYVDLATQTFGVVLVICALYLALCVMGTRVMASRKPFKLGRMLTSWNLLLSMFSAVGFLRTAPHLVYYLSRTGLYASVRWLRALPCSRGASLLGASSPPAPVALAYFACGADMYAG